MTTKARQLRPRPARSILTLGLLVGLAAALGTLLPGTRAAAQAQNPCALLTQEELQAFAPKETVGDGVASANDALGSSTCRYVWGAGAWRSMLTVSVNPAASKYPGLTLDAIKGRMLSSPVVGTADAIIQGVGDASVFKVHSPVYVSVTTYAKDKLLQLNLDGHDAREKQDALTALLKSAVARL
jgi:hypothetical protein